jgi:hypothetical protein
MVFPSGFTLTLAAVDTGAAICINVVIGGVTAAICGSVASSKGRNALGWACIGGAVGFLCSFILFWIPILVVCVLPNLKEQASREQAIAEENRRLREQVRQEKLKAEAFRQHAARRLDVHDQHMGIDTRGALALEGAGAAGQLGYDDPAQELAAALEGQSAPDDGAEIWYYEMLGQTQGPVSAAALRALLGDGTLRGDSLLWSQDLGNWTPARQVPQFENDIRA